MRGKSWLGGLGVIVLILSCTGDGSNRGESFQPRFEELPCPSDVEIQTLPEHSCGYLTVLEDRANPNGRTIRVFVLKVLPPRTSIQKTRSSSSAGISARQRRSAAAHRWQLASTGSRT